MPGWLGRAAGSLQGAASKTFGDVGGKAMGSLNRGLLELGSVGGRSGTTRGMLTNLKGSGAAVDARRAQLTDQLLTQGRRRAIIGGAGVGAVGISSGVNGTRARSSGGYA